MLNKNSNFSPLIFAIVLIIGIWLGKSLRFGDFKKGEVNKFNLILEQLEEAYVDSINKDDLIEKAVTNLLKELDPHSYYIKAKDLSAIKLKIYLLLTNLWKAVLMVLVLSLIY